MGGEREKLNGANYLSEKRQVKDFLVAGKRGEVREKNLKLILITFD